MARQIRLSCHYEKIYSLIYNDAYIMQPENKEKNKNIVKDPATLFVRICGIFLFSIVSVLLAYLTFQSARISMYSSNKYSGYNWPVEIADSLPKNLLFSLAAIAVIYACFLFEKKHQKASAIISYISLVLVLILYTVLGIIYVKTTPYYPSGDQINTTAAALYALEGNYSMFTPMGYIGICPHQKGLLFFYEIIFKFFGPLNFTAAGMINLLLNDLTILTGYFLIKELRGGYAPRFLWTIFTALLLPYFILIPYAYGDLPSVFGIMVFVFFFIKFLNSGKIIYALLSAPGAAFAILNRSSAWIAVFALIIVSFLISVQRKKISPLITMLAVTVFSYACLFFINVGYEKLSGFDRHTGSPTIAYIAMGMQTTDGASGVYNRYHQEVYERYDGNKALASEEAKEYISERLSEFREYPGLAKDFYRNKILLQWIEPMFESNTHMKSFKEGISLETLSPFYIRAYVGDIHIIMFKMMNKYQTLIYLLCLISSVRALICLIKNKKEPMTIHWFFSIFMLGGFIFSLIWEAKARYSLPYFIFLIPVSVLLFTDLKAFPRFGNKQEETEHQQ